MPREGRCDWICLSSVVTLSLGLDNWRLSAKMFNNEAFIKKRHMNAYRERKTERDIGTVFPSVCILWMAIKCGRTQWRDKRSKPGAGRRTARGTRCQPEASEQAFLVFHRYIFSLTACMHFHGFRYNDIGLHTHPVSTYLTWVSWFQLSILKYLQAYPGDPRTSIQEQPTDTYFSCLSHFAWHLCYFLLSTDHHSHVSYLLLVLKCIPSPLVPIIPRQDTF